MFGAILILLTLPYSDRSVIRGNLGQLHVEVPYIALGQYATAYYFAHYLIIVPLISTLENILYYIGTLKKV
ncbi:COB Cytochrome b [Candida maltosa Xu316]